MAFIKFAQDPNLEFGAGDFTHESGQVMPLYDPMEAQRLSAQSQAQDAPEPPPVAPPTPAPTAMTPQGPETSAPSPVPATPPKPEKPGAMQDLPEGAKRLKDDEADNDLRKRSMQIVNAVKDYPMGSVVPFGDGVYGRVEQHTWTNKDGKRVPGHFRGVTLYKDGAPKPTAEADTENAGTSYPGDTEQGPPAAPVSKADVSTSTAKSTYKSPWNADETKAMQDLIKEYPKLTEEGVTNIFRHETGADLSPTRRNSLGYGGLFQLQPSQEKSLIPGGDITKLSRAQQIEQYGNYLQSHNIPRDATDSDLALAQAAPGAIGKPDDTVIYKAGSEEAKANPAWLDKSGNATVASIKAYYGSEGPGTTTQAANGPDPSTIGPNTAVQMAGQQSSTQGTSSSSGESVDKGTPFTPDQQNAWQKTGADYENKMRASAQPVFSAQDAANLQMQKQAGDTKILLDQRANEETQAKTNYQQTISDIAARQKLVDEDKEPPPFGGNVLAGIIAALAQGAGAYAAAINHTDNFAMNIINRGLAADNAKWKQQHMDKVYGVKNAQDLNRAARLDLDHAVTQREIQQRMQIDAEGKAMLGQVATAQGKAALEQTLAQNAQMREDKQLELQRQSLDKVRTSNQSGATSSNTSGTSWQTKDKPAAAAMDLTKYGSGPRAGVAGRSDLDKMEQDLKNLTDPLNLKYDPKTKTFTRPETDDAETAAARATPGVGNFLLEKDRIARNPLTGEALGPLGTFIKHPIDSIFNTESGEARKRAHETLTTTLDARMYLLSGKAINENEAKRMAEEVKGLSPEGQLAEMNSLMAAIQQRKVDLNNQFPGADDEWNRRNAANQEKAGIGTVNFVPGVK